MSQKSWPKEKDQRFIDMLLLEPGSNVPLNIDELAMAFKLTPLTVHQRISRYRSEGKIPRFDPSGRIVEHRRGYSISEKSIIREMYTRGIPSRIIAERLGRTQAAINDQEALMRRRKEMPGRAKPWRKDQLQIIKDNICLDENNCVSNLHRLSSLTGHSYSATRTKIMEIRRQGELPKVLGNNCKWTNKGREMNARIWGK